jgi:hypothetical protein
VLHPDVIRMLVSIRQAEMRKNAARERQYRVTLKDGHWHLAGLGNRLRRIVSLVRLRRHSHNLRLAQRCYPGRWHVEVMAIVEHGEITN